MKPEKKMLVEWIEIPSGSFEMGAVDDDKFATNSERPRKAVEISNGFAMSRYPITVEQYREYLQAEPAADSPRGIDQAEPKWPVMGVNRNDALRFCDWLSKTNDQSIGLPTETQWEYACRAGTQSVFYTGDVLSLEVANFAYNEAGKTVGLSSPTPVGVFPSNPWGLYDMLGSVQELVADDWRPDLTGDPTFGQNRFSVVRGGAWDHMPRLLRCSHRDWIDNDGLRLNNMGFRVTSCIG